MVAHPECKEGNAPNTNGDVPKVEPYISKPNISSIRNNPPASPGIE